MVLILNFIPVMVTQLWRDKAVWRRRYHSAHAFDTAASPDTAPDKNTR